MRRHMTSMLPSHRGTITFLERVRGEDAGPTTTLLQETERFEHHGRQRAEEAKRCQPPPALTTRKVRPTPTSSSSNRRLGIESATETRNKPRRWHRWLCDSSCRDHCRALELYHLSSTSSLEFSLSIRRGSALTPDSFAACTRSKSQALQDPPDKKDHRPPWCCSHTLQAAPAWRSVAPWTGVRS